jgi:hypothetical protein
LLSLSLSLLTSLSLISTTEQKLLTSASSSHGSPQEARPSDDDDSAPSWKTRFFSLFRRNSDSDEESAEDKDEDEGPVEPPRDPDDEEADALINQVKEMTGLWELDPDDSTWLHLDSLDHESGIREPMGRLCYGLQLWPKDKAMIMNVGTARSAPNQDPFLPPPTGRLQFSWNPFYMSALPLPPPSSSSSPSGASRSAAPLSVRRSSVVSSVWGSWLSWSSANPPSTSSSPSSSTELPSLPWSLKEAALPMAGDEEIRN